MQVTSAILLAFGSPLDTSESLQTAGSVQISDSAGISVVNDPTLLLIISSGSAMWPTAAPVRASSTEDDTAAAIPLIVAQSGFSSTFSSSGEVLSVSIINDAVGSNTSGVELKAVIAQFN